MNDHQFSHKFSFLFNKDNFVPVTNCLFFLIFIIYIVLAILLPASYDYLSVWSGAIQINEGIPLYEQEVDIRYVNGRQAAYPSHLPVFIYFLAFTIRLFGDYLYVGKIIVIVFTFLNALILKRIIEENMGFTNNFYLKELIPLVYVLNPQMIIYTYQGYFDAFSLFFALLSIFFCMKLNNNKSLLKKLFYISLVSLSVLLGFLSKVIPLTILPILFLFFVGNKQYFEAITISFFSSFLSLGSILLLNFLYPRFSFIFLEWQLSRINYGLSLFNSIIHQSGYINALMVIFSLLFVSLLYFKDILLKKNSSFFLFSGLMLLSFNMLYRGYFPHYIIWFIPFFTYLVFKFYNQRDYLKLSAIIFSFFFNMVIFSIAGDLSVTGNSTTLKICTILNFLCLCVYWLFLYTQRIID